MSTSWWETDDNKLTAVPNEIKSFAKLIGVSLCNWFVMLVDNKIENLANDSVVLELNKKNAKVYLKSWSEWYRLSIHQIKKYRKFNLIGVSDEKIEHILVVFIQWS